MQALYFCFILEAALSNNGRDYEEFVASLQKALFESEKWTELRNIQIEQNKKIKDNDMNAMKTGNTL